MIGVFSISQKLFFVAKFIFWQIFGCVFKRTRVTKTLVNQSSKGWTVLHLQCKENDLNCLQAVFYKWYNKSIKLLIFGKIFNNDCFDFWIFNLSDLNQAYINKPYKTIVFSSVFEKKIIREIYRTQDYVMHTKNYILPAKKCFSGKCFNAHQIRFAVKKSKKNVGAIFQNFLKNFLCRHQKMPFIQFPYM